MGQNQLSVNAQIGLTLGVLLFFSIVMTFVGYMAGDQVRAKIAAFANEGVTVPGAITKKHVDIVRPTKGATQVHWLDVSFTTEAGALRNDSLQVTNTIYYRYAAGDPVQITYARSKPEWFYVPGAQPTQWDITTSDGILEYGAMAAVFFLVCFIAWWFVGRGGDTPSPVRRW